MSGSSSLRAKQALFDDWGLSDDDSKVALLAESVVKREEDEDEEDNDGEADIKPKLSDAEVEHRRKSRAFAVAAKAAQAEEERRKLRKAERRELRERRRREEELREKEERQQQLRLQTEEQRRRERSARAGPRPLPQVIDLTGLKVTPIPPPQIPPPPRRAQSAVEFVRKSGTLRRTSSNPLPTSQGGQTKKRKTESTSFSSIPSSASTSTSTSRRDIFSGLSFYYLPDAALGARKLRIAKARQHGAAWVRNLGEATHVIVDKPFKWAEIASAVEGRRPDAIVVYDEYPLDCIGFRCLLNPAQRRYQIRGRDGEAAEAAEAAKTERSTKKSTEKSTEMPTEKSTANDTKREPYTIKPPSRRLAGLSSSSSTSRSREREQMIRQPRKGG